MRRAKASMIAVTQFRIPSAELEILRDITKQTRAATPAPLPQIVARALRKTKKSPQPMNCGQVPYQEGG
ncbi:hypothetical protein [Herbaspirillum huttiense]|uniref:Uncharacterized protein n=2 Tax=Herbaspirillum huttiense TaxID=863372 RepID=A0AAJ2LYA1_9BURK|nr:hypothetical protein [Herbaspirillum huttiense]MDR9839268.1 hypothetical protein [Herbaspirillum huttiense]